MRQTYQRPIIVVFGLAPKDVITASGTLPVTPTEEPTLPNKDNEYGFDDLF